jgi:hypothetical protein
VFAPALLHRLSSSGRSFAQETIFARFSENRVLCSHRVARRRKVPRATIKIVIRARYRTSGLSSGIMEMHRVLEKSSTNGTFARFSLALKHSDQRSKSEFSRNINRSPLASSGSLAVDLTTIIQKATRLRSGRAPRPSAFAASSFMADSKG